MPPPPPQCGGEKHTRTHAQTQTIKGIITLKILAYFILSECYVIVRATTLDVTHTKMMNHCLGAGASGA